MAAPKPLRRRRWPLALAGLIAVIVIAGGAGALWLIGTAAGLEWLLARAVPQATVVGLAGSLRGPLGAERLTFSLGDRRVVVTGLTINWRPAALWQRRLQIAALTAASVEVTAPRSDEPPVPPESLELPLAVAIEQLTIASLRLRVADDGSLRFAATDISARADSDGRHHRLHELRATHDYGSVVGSGDIAARPPFALKGAAQFAGRGAAGAAPPTVRANAVGTLTELAVAASGEGLGLSGSAEVRLQPFAAFPLAELRLALDEFDPRRFSARAPPARLTLDARLQALPDGRLSGPVHADNAAPAALDRGGLPVTAASAQVTVGSDQLVILDDLELALAGGGRIAGKASWRRHEASGSADLRVERLNLAALDTRLRASRLAGTATLTGGIEAQQGRLALADGALRIDAELARAGDEVTLERLQLRVGRNRLDAAGRYGGRGNRLELTVDAPALGELGPGFGGALSAQASLAGRLAQPQGSFKAQGRELVLLSAHRLARLALAGELRGEALKLKLDVDDYAGEKDAEPLVRRLTATAGGRRSDHELEVDAELAAGRRLHLSARGALSGELERWRMARWKGTVTEFAAALPWSLRLLSPAAVQLAGERIEIGAAAFAAGGGRIEHGFSAWTPRGWQSRGRFSGVGLRLASDELPRGGESLRLGGGWDVAGVGVRLSGRVDAAREAGDWILPGEPPLPLGIGELQLALRGDGDRADIQLTARGERLGNWRGRLALRLPAQRSAWTLPPATALDGSLAVELGDIAWLGAALGSELSSAGKLALDMTIAGTIAAPDFRGQLRGRDLAVALAEEGVRLEHGELAAEFDASRLRIDRLHFAAPPSPPARSLMTGPLPFPLAPGTLDATGSIDLQARSGSLDFRASRVPLSQRADRWIVASGNGRAELADARLKLAVDAVADAGFIAEPPADRPRLSADVVVAGRQPPPGGTRVDLTADADLGRHFRLRAAGLDARLEGRLRVRGEAGRPLRASGSIAAVDGTFQAYGQRLTVERGIVNFQGAVDNPGLNVLALRKGLAVEAGVEVTGNLRRPKVRLVSTPPVSDPEKLSWIVLGRAPEAGGVDNALLIAAATALLGGQSGGPVGELARAFGVDELGLRSETGAESLTGQILTIGKRLSSRATLAYEQGLSAAAGVVKLSYQLTPRISVVGRAGADNAIDLYYTFSFD